MNLRTARLAAVLAVVALVGCGSSSSPSWAGRGTVRWSKAPYVYAPAKLRHDRVILGQVRNTGGRLLTLDARRIVVHDGAGRVLVSSARFTNSYGHPLYGAFQKPSYVDPTELARLGIVSAIVPGTTVAFFVSYRLRPGSKPPITAIIVPGPPLPLPETPGHP